MVGVNCAPGSTRPYIGAQRACPDCGQPQHYTGTEHGWTHDAVATPQGYAEPGCLRQA